MLARASSAVLRQQQSKRLLVVASVTRARICGRGILASVASSRSITSSSSSVFSASSLSSTLNRMTSHGFSSALLTRVLTPQATEICGGLLQQQSRCFSKKSKKGKGKESEGGGGGGGEDEGDDVFDWDPDEVSLEMEEAIERLQRRLGRIRSGHNPVDSFNAVLVEAYGERVPLAQVGQVVSKNPRLVTVNVYDKENVAAVDEAIRAFDSDLNPTVADNILTIQLVKVTKEAREKNAKEAKSNAEGIKTQIRNIRHEHLNAIKKSDALTEDERYQLQDELQAITDTFTKKVDDVVAKKTDEIMKM